MTSINDLQNDPKNARKRTDRSAKLIKQSLEQYGAARSIVIDENNRILAGNGTIAGAKAAGIKNLKIIESNGDEIIAVKRTGLSEEEKVGLAIADNRTGDLSEWDVDMLEQLSKEQDLNDFFDKKELDDILSKKEVLPTDGLTDPDDVPKVPEEPVTKEGDLYILGNHRLLCGDCKNTNNFEKLMNQKKVDMVLTDPPYGMNLDTDYSSMGNKSKKHKPIFDDDKEFIYFDLGCKEQFWFGGDYYCNTLPKNGSWFVWDKYPTDQNDKRFGSSFELIWSKERHKRIIYRVFSLNVGHYKREQIEHPTQKPSDLLISIINKYSVENAIIWDGFLGSGSTLIACEKTKRKCFGFEIDPHYCDVIVKRWEDFTGNKGKRVSSN